MLNNRMFEVKQLGPVRLETFKSMNFSFSDFCSPEGTVEFVVHNGFLKNSIKLFSFTYDNFIIEAKIRDGMVFIMRNGLYQNSEQYLGDEPRRVAIQWSSNSIGCGIFPPNFEAKLNLDSSVRAIKTPLTYPPLEIVNILRKENLLFNEKYNNMNDLLTSVIDSLHCCENDIRRFGAQKNLWKKNKKGLEPVGEPDISKLIASHLNVYGALKNFDISCESTAGLGNIDFYISAPVSDRIGKIAIEAKKAESKDLVRGFTTQLLDYMKSINTEYGIYLVYWMKSPNYLFPPKYASFTEMEIEKLHSIPRIESIRVLGMNLSMGLSPSSK